MPYIFGNHVPDIFNSLPASHELRLLVDSRQVSPALGPFLTELTVLVAYLKSLDTNPVLLYTLLSSEFSPSFPSFLEVNWLQATDTTATDASKVVELAATYEIDIIATTVPAEYSKLETVGQFSVCSLEDAKTHIEWFVKGHDIPWSFAQPLWNMGWTAFYAMTDKFCSDLLRAYSSDFTNVTLQPRHQEIIRSWLLNRPSNILYTFDKLQFFRIQRAIAFRKHLKRQKFQFEVGYYLGVFYALLWGSFDQMSRVINALLDLRAEKMGITVANERFLKLVRRVDSQLSALYEAENLKEWLSRLGEKRHYGAHESQMILSDLVTDPEEQLTEDEIFRKVDEQLSGNDFYKMYPIEAQRNLRNQLAAEFRLAQYPRLSEEISVFATDKGFRVFYPFQELQEDLDNYKLITHKTISLLMPHLRSKA